MLQRSLLALQTKHFLVGCLVYLQRLSVVFSHTKGRVQTQNGRLKWNLSLYVCVLVMWHVSYSMFSYFNQSKAYVGFFFFFLHFFQYHQINSECFENTKFIT